MKTMTSTIEWLPFSDKHKLYIKTAMQNDFNVAEGAVRSGKTIDHCIIASMILENCPDKIHLASGSTLPNAKLNIGDCNGYGLEHLFRGRCRWGEYKGNDALFIATKTGEKIVIFAGGGKADSYKKILGNSYGLWIATEINEHYDCDDSRTSFIKVATDRQLAAKKRTTLWDLNPSNPDHRIYKDYIDKYIINKKPRYNYQHFTINDNATISEERKAEIKADYTEGTVWYNRNILGQRCVAEGIIFRYFTDNQEPFMLDDKDLFDDNGKLKINLSKVTIGVDFGGTGSKTTMFATGFVGGYQALIGLDEDELPVTEEIDSDQICNKVLEFHNRVMETFGRCDYIFCDSASPTMINSIRSRFRQVGLRNNHITGCRKNEVSERPKLIDLLFNTGRLTIRRKCVNTRNAIASLRWDDKKPDIPEDKNINNINDHWDCFNYTILDFAEYIELNRSR